MLSGLIFHSAASIIMQLESVVFVARLFEQVENDRFTLLNSADPSQTLLIVACRRQPTLGTMMLLQTILHHNSYSSVASNLL